MKFFLRETDLSFFFQVPFFLRQYVRELCQSRFRGHVIARDDTGIGQCLTDPVNSPHATFQTLRAVNNDNTSGCSSSQRWNDVIPCIGDISRTVAVENNAFNRLFQKNLNLQKKRKASKYTNQNKVCQTKLINLALMNHFFHPTWFIMQNLKKSFL